jgi:hypothetical protein
LSHGPKWDFAVSKSLFSHWPIVDSNGIKRYVVHFDHRPVKAIFGGSIPFLMASARAVRPRRASSDPWRAMVTSSRPIIARNENFRSKAERCFVAFIPSRDRRFNLTFKTSLLLDTENVGEKRL